LEYFRVMLNDTELSENFMNRLLGEPSSMNRNTPSVMI